MAPSVSICIANYNMADTIEESLDSIVEHLPSSYELVIVDESDDGSREIIEGLDVQNPVKSVYVDDYGLSRSRNLAVEEASGEIVITHVDMDDRYDSRYFDPFVELYVRIRESRDGQDFFFACPNFNITSREAYLEKYRLRDLPIGPGERDYRWRVITSDEFIRVTVDADVSERIKLSGRKTILSRARRAFNLVEGLFVIGYSARRIVDEEVFDRGDPYYSQLYKLAILPIAFVTSRFKESIDGDVPEGGDSLESEMKRRTYTVSELQEEYDIDQELKINELVGRGNRRRES